MQTKLVALTFTILAVSLAGCSSSSSGSSAGNDSDFVNGFYRTEYTFEDFNSGVNDTVTATISDDSKRITEIGVGSDGDSYTITHDLDDSGRLVTRTTTAADGTVELMQTYSYGANGYPDSYLGVFADTSERRETIMWTADDKIDLITRTNIDEFGDLNSSYTYDFIYNNGVLVSMREEPVPNPDNEFGEFTYIVDENGRVEERSYVDFSGDAGETSQWEFDANGNQRIQTRYNSDGSLRSRLTTTYAPTDKKVYNRNIFQRIMTP